ncbi:phosphonate ABC transporter, permease protein PhnE [Rhizobium giardinii]|uniref:phosphonate ABC transporter, permease protein PhnE n=1 Tax=Rhizobium giardinii TaxID=56731 RepID=UPI003D6E1022
MTVNTMMNAAEMESIAARHPHLIHGSSRKRIRSALIFAGIALYMIYSWWFFSIGQVLTNANWSIAGTYLADWVSYEVRPDIKIAADGAMQVVYPRFSPLGPDAKPEWVKIETRMVERAIDAPAATQQALPTNSSTFSFMAPKSAVGRSAEAEVKPERRSEEVVSRATISFNSATNVDVVDRTVTATHNGETLLIDLDPGRGVQPKGDLPDWATQKRPGEKITLAFGMTGWADVDVEKVSIHNRFPGWANFIFDTNSPFFNKSFGEVAGLIFAGERLDPARSNLSLAWNNILYNAEWQHVDVWTKLLQTIVMAFVGTLFASIVAFPLCFLAARNITRNGVLNQVTKRFFDFLRSVDMLIWALFFTRAFGPGPLAGMSAIFFTDTGTLGKLYSEALENIDDKQREGVKSVGAAPLAVQRFGVLPQVLPVFASQALYFWESNTRSATIIGAVGAGGIGLKLWEAMRTNSDWENVCYMVILILVVVFIFDSVSNLLRSRLMGQKTH